MTKVSFTEIRNHDGRIGALPYLRQVAPTEALDLWEAYRDVKRTVVPERRETAFRGLVRARKMEMPIVPLPEEGNVLLLKAVRAFPTSDGTIVGPLVALAYRWNGKEYWVSNTPVSKVANLEECYYNTHNEEVLKKFAYAVYGHQYENYITSLFENRRYYKNTPIFRELRKRGNVDWVEYNPLAGLDEETAARTEAARDDYVLCKWGNMVVKAASEIASRPSEEAEELAMLIKNQLDDMTDTEVGQPRCGEYLEDPLCDDGSYELEYRKRQVVARQKERDFDWALKKELSIAAKENGAAEFSKWVQKWNPSKENNINPKGDAFLLAKAIGYSEAVKLFCQQFGERTERNLELFKEFSPEMKNAFEASEKVLNALINGCTLEEALKLSDYSFFLDSLEKLQYEEIDTTVVYNWLKSSKPEKYKDTLEKVESAYKEARLTQLENARVNTLVKLVKLERKVKAGLPVDIEEVNKLRSRNMKLSKKINSLQG